MKTILPLPEILTQQVLIENLPFSDTVSYAWEVFVEITFYEA